MKKKSKVKKKSMAVWKKMLCLLTFVGLGFFFFTGFTYAASDEEIISVLSNNSDLFENNGIFTSAIRSLGWIVIKLLVKLSDAAEGLFDAAFGFVDFTQYGPVQNFINSFKPVFIALICLSLVFLGIILILHHEKKPKLVINICIAVLVVSASTYMIDQMNGMISPEVRSQIISGSSSDQNITYQVVSNSIYDLRYLDTHIGLMNVTPENRARRDFDSGQLARIDINEVVKPDDVSEESKDLVQKTLTTNGDGNDALEDVNDGVAWTDFLNTYYFRYQVSWLQCIIMLLSLIIVYICLAYKTVRILYEIVIHQLMAYLYSANLTDNQKVVKILNSLKDSYITLILVVICMKIYLLAYTFINSLDYGDFTKAFMLLFVALAVIDGPNIVQKITGIDAGMTDGTHKLIAAFSGGRMVAGGLKAAGKATGDLGKTALNAHRNNEKMKENVLKNAAQKDMAASNLTSDAKENAGEAMPGSLSNSSENSEINNGNTDTHNSRNSADILNEGGSDLNTTDISSENNVDGATGGNDLNTTDISSESNVDGATGGSDLNTTDISSENNVNGATDLNTTDISSENNVNGATDLNTTDTSCENGNAVTNDSSQLNLGNSEGIPEGSGFSEGEAEPQSVEGDVPAESAFDGMMQNNGTDPLTGESNGANDLARMEEELSQDGLTYDSGLSDSEPITYGGSMLNGMDGLKEDSSQRDLGRDIEGQGSQPLSNTTTNSTSNLGHGQLESNHMGSNLGGTNQAARGTTGSTHMSSGSVGKASISNESETRASNNVSKGHGDLGDKVNLENI